MSLSNSDTLQSMQKISGRRLTLSVATIKSSLFLSIVLPLSRCLLNPRTVAGLVEWHFWANLLLPLLADVCTLFYSTWKHSIPLDNWAFHGTPSTTLVPCSRLYPSSEQLVMPSRCAICPKWKALVENTKASFSPIESRTILKSSDKIRN